MNVRLVKERDFNNWIEMRQDLWPDCPLIEHKKECVDSLKNIEETPIFVLEINNELIGFIEASIHEYAPGCHTSNLG